MNLEFLSTVAVVAPDPPASRKLYLETLGLPLEGHGGDYLHKRLPGWASLRSAAHALPNDICKC